MIWIIAGTSEARELINRISDLDSFVATIATDEGKEFIPSEKVVVGRMNYDEMREFSIEKKISLIIDLTHPYAKIVSRNAKRIAKELNIKYTRYTREKNKETLNSIIIDSYKNTYEYLKSLKGTVFFTTGSKNIGDFEKVRGSNRFIYRILPVIDSIEKCNNHNLDMRDIVAVLGPFSVDYNKAMFKEYKADFVVMKDSGIRGGTTEKIKACGELNIVPIIIGRENEKGINDLNKIEEIIRKETL